MDKQTLMKYMSLNKAIEQLKKNIAKYEDPPGAVHGKVKGSSKSFPYTARTFSTGGASELGDEKSRQLKKGALLMKLHQKEKELNKIDIEVQNFLADILPEDPETYNVFNMYFVEGKTLDRIGIELDMDKSTASRIIKKYLESVN